MIATALHGKPQWHYFRCERCKRDVKRPAHLILRSLVCYECRRQPADGGVR